jgi:hypothetical protein
MKVTRAEEEEAMQVVIHQNRNESPARRETSSSQSRTLLWACAGLLETLCLLGGLYWVMIANDPRPLALRVSLVAALAVLCGVATVFALAKQGREK